MDDNQQPLEPNTPDMGGGLPVIKYWAEHTLSPEGAKLVANTIT